MRESSGSPPEFVKYVVTLTWDRLRPRKTLSDSHLPTRVPRRFTCTTKHALLAALAREQHINAQLVLGIYEMSERNTPGVGHVLSRYGLSYIPEAHCHLRYKVSGST